jgi:hypothetical protein
MPWLIDAANLGGVLGGAAGARNPQAILAALLPWARQRKQVVVVFDGEEPSGMATRLGGVEIVWSGRQSADVVIEKRLAREAQQAKAWTVITNDRNLARRCKELGATVEPAKEFTRRSAQPAAKSKADRSARAAADKPAPNAQEIAHWRAVFGGEAKEEQIKKKR